jgi:hypothetical protein
MKYIYHHLGLGDHIICNGLVRSLITNTENYKMFVKSHNYESVKFMYRDLKNLDFIIGDDSFVQNFLTENNIIASDLISAGFYRHPNAESFDESFYLQNNLELNFRWDNFFVDRDLDSEITLFNKFDVTKNEYVFIHDDKSRNYEIDETKIINKHLKIVRPVLDYTNNVFDYCYLMENSIESHFIDSSFRLIFDSLKLRNTNIYYHIKLKNGGSRNTNKYDDARSSLLNFIIFE